MKRKVKKKRLRFRFSLAQFIEFALDLFLMGYGLYHWVALPIIDKYFSTVIAIEPENVYGVEVITDFIKEGSHNRPGIKRNIKYIVIHETGNPKAGSTAENHSTYLKKNSKVTNSWHYTVDDTEVYHHLPDDEVGWHASDGLKKNGGNLNGIGIEICVNSDGDFDTAVENAAKLTAYLLHAYHLDMNDIKQHGDFTRKNCPQTLRDTGKWEDFIELVKIYY